MGRSVALVDASLQFGDVGVLLNLNPKNKSIVDVLGDVGNGDVDLIDSTLVSHSTGIRVLLAPPSPEMAELVTVDHIRRVIGRLRDDPRPRDRRQLAVLPGQHARAPGHVRPDPRAC